MNALERTIAVARGEAVAAQILASMALQLMLRNVSNPQEAIRG